MNLQRTIIGLMLTTGFLLISTITLFVGLTNANQKLAETNLLMEENTLQVSEILKSFENEIADRNLLIESRLMNLEAIAEQLPAGQFILREDFIYNNKAVWIELHYSVMYDITTLDYITGCVEVCETEQINQIFDEEVTGMTVEEWWRNWLETYMIVIEIVDN